LASGAKVTRSDGPLIDVHLRVAERLLGYIFPELRSNFDPRSGVDSFLHKALQFLASLWYLALGEQGIYGVAGQGVVLRQFKSSVFGVYDSQLCHRYDGVSFSQHGRYRAVMQVVLQGSGSGRATDATGERFAVEIESEWTAARRNRAAAKTHVSEARRGAPDFEEG